MHGLPLRFKSVFNTERPLSYHLQLARARSKTLAIPALTLGTLVLGAAAGLLAAMLPLLPERRVKLLAGLPVLLLAFHSPHLLILLILAAGSTIIDPKALPNVFRLTIIELCLLLLLGLILTRALSDRDKYAWVGTPLDWPILLFVAASVVSLVNAKYILGTYDTQSFAVWRVFLDYMAFFAVTNLVRTRRQLMTLVGGMLAMATLSAAFMVAQQAVGPSRNILPGSMSVWTANVFTQQFSGVARIHIPGSAMVYVMLMPALILYVTPGYLEGHKWLSFVPVILLPLAVAFTFSRNLWIGVTLAILTFVAVARIESKKLVSLLAVLVVLVALLGPLASSYYPRVDAIAEALFFRANSLFARDELAYDSSTQWRLNENEQAVPKIMEYPVFGLGPGADYRKPFGSTDWLTHYIHNGYLYLLLDVGIIGFLPFLWFSIVYLVRAFSHWHTLQDPVLKALVLSFAVSYIAILSSTTAAPHLLESNFVLLLAVLLGISEVAIRLEGRSSRGCQILTDQTNLE
jgi:hypothetical protein